MECYTPGSMLQHSSRTAEAAEASISIRPCRTTRLMRKHVQSLTPKISLSRCHTG